MFRIILTSLVLTLWYPHQAANNTYGEREKSLQNLHETSGEGNLENMIWVEKGLRELASLKVKNLNMRTLLVDYILYKKQISVVR